MANAPGAGIGRDLPSAKSWHRIIYSGVAQCALNPHRTEGSRGIEVSSYTDDCIQLQQRQRYGGIVEIDAAFLELLHQVRWQCVKVHFQANRQSSFRTDSWTNSAETGSFDCLVEFDCVAPE